MGLLPLRHRNTPGLLQRVTEGGPWSPLCSFRELSYEVVLIALEKLKSRMMW